MQGLHGFWNAWTFGSQCTSVAAGTPKHAQGWGCDESSWIFQIPGYFQSLCMLSFPTETYPSASKMSRLPEIWDHSLIPPWPTHCSTPKPVKFRCSNNAVSSESSAGKMPFFAVIAVILQSLVFLPKKKRPQHLWDFPWRLYRGEKSAAKSQRKKQNKKQNNTSSPPNIKFKDLHSSSGAARSSDPDI